MVAGLLLLVAGLLRPWLQVPLLSSRSAFELPVRAPGLPSQLSLSYGVLLAICALATAAGLIRTRGRASAIAAAAGAVGAVLCIMAFAQITIWDITTRAELESQAARQQTVRLQYGYKIHTTPPTAVALFKPRGAVEVVLNDLDQGFYLAIAGALILSVAGRQSLLNHLRRRKLAIGVSVAAGAGLAGMCAGGVAAAILMSTLDAALVKGDAATAVDRLELALRLNPTLAADPDFELRLGKAQLEAGRTELPAALFAASRLVSERGDKATQLADLKAAWRAAPGNPVIGDEYRMASIGVSQLLLDPAPLLDLPGGLRDDVVVQYTLGRLYFARGSYVAAIGALGRSVELTRDRDLLSSAHTYLAICYDDLGFEQIARHELLAAIQLDFTYSNSLARSRALGLYQAFSP
jgi:tetratricopeptide (TPR) repeat protein